MWTDFWSFGVTFFAKSSSKFPTSTESALLAISGRSRDPPTFTPVHCSTEPVAGFHPWSCWFHQCFHGWWAAWRDCWFLSQTGGKSWFSRWSHLCCTCCSNGTTAELEVVFLRFGAVASLAFVSAPCSLPLAFACRCPYPPLLSRTRKSAFSRHQPWTFVRRVRLSSLRVLFGHCDILIRKNWRFYCSAAWLPLPRVLAQCECFPHHFSEKVSGADLVI